MNKVKWVFILFVFLVACAPQTAMLSPKSPPDITPTATHTPKPTPTIAPTFTPEYTDTTAFGIDYDNPEKYLTPGNQTRISAHEALLRNLQSDQRGIAHLRSIYLWKESEFKTYPAGGATIGVVTVNRILEERLLGGCNDHALLFIAVVRKLGYPAVFVNTNSIAWMELYQADKSKQYVGHIFAEVYVDNKWVLINPTGGEHILEDYDPTNPVIPLQGAIAGSSEEIYGFYVINKGIDEWDLGIHSKKDLFAMMKKVADQVVLESLVYPAYVFKRFK